MKLRMTLNCCPSRLHLQVLGLQVCYAFCEAPETHPRFVHAYPALCHLAVHPPPQPQSSLGVLECPDHSLSNQTGLYQMGSCYSFPLP